MVNDDHESVLHIYGDTGLQRFWGHEFDLLGSRDIFGHVTIGLGLCGFLFAVHCNHASILHRYGDMGPQRYWGHDFDLLGSRDVIDHVTIGLRVGTFLLVVNDDHASILHRYGVINLKVAFAHVKDQKFTAHAPCHVTCRRGVQNDHIFGIPEAILPIHYTTFMGLRRTLLTV